MKLQQLIITINEKAKQNENLIQSLNKLYCSFCARESDVR